MQGAPKPDLLGRLKSHELILGDGILEEGFGASFEGIGPAVTIRKALTKREELGIPEHVIDTLPIAFLALVMEWDLFIVSLVALVEVPLTVQAIQNCWRRANDRKEISYIDSIEFSQETCMPIVVNGFYRPRRAREFGDTVYGTSRIAILAALMRSFTDEDLQDALRITLHRDRRGRRPKP